MGARAHTHMRARARTVLGQKISYGKPLLAGTLRNTARAETSAEAQSVTEVSIV